jgi:triosephosphate isomerase (TIM)
MKAPLVVGNWKMHGTQSDCVDRARSIINGLHEKPSSAEVVFAPPFTALTVVKQALHDREVRLAAQNCHWQEQGPFTGEVSPTMLRDVGCDFVILGHSERRHIFNEPDSFVAQKLNAALQTGLTAILCVGETSAERRKQQTSRVISRQLRIALKGVEKSAIDKIEIAYEPVWAIGTGQNATSKQISQVHGAIRRFLVKGFGEDSGGRIRILYGGSVNPNNATELAQTENVSGFLVGGASLKSETFLPIVRSFTAN